MNSTIARVGRLSALYALFAALGACSSFPVGQYAPLDSTRAALGQQGLTQKVQVQDFSSAKPGVTSISCRGAGSFVFPGGDTPERYLSNALRKELRYANLEEVNAPIQISGRVEHFDVSSNVGVARWEFHLRVVNGNEHFDLKYEHRVKTAWLAERACGAVAEQFVGAAQALTAQILTHEKFINWLK